MDLVSLHNHLTIIIFFAYSKGTKPADDNGTRSGTLEELIIYESGSNVTIDCYAECSSYLVVYRAYDDPTLNPIHHTTFPVTISLEIGTYTFAVFEITESSTGVNDIDELSLLKKVVRVMPENNNVLPSETITSTVMISVPTPTPSEPTIDGNCSVLRGPLFQSSLMHPHKSISSAWIMNIELYAWFLAHTTGASAITTTRGIRT